MKLNPYHPLGFGLKMSLLFNEGGGTILYDSTGNMNHGTGTNHAFGADGLILAGDNENITIPNFIGQDDDWTIFVAFNQSIKNPNTQASKTMLASMKTGTVGTGRAILFIDDLSGGTNKLGSYIDGTNNYSNSVISLDEDYSAALTQNGTLFNFYLNGESDGSFTATADAANGDIVLFDHRNNPGTGCFAGTSKVFHIYDRPLSAAENIWLDRDPTGMFIPDFTPSIITVAGEAGVANAGAMMMAMMI